MKREVFLEKYRSKKSVNVESKLSVSLSTKNRVFADSSVDSEFSLYDQYNAERDACEKYRMIFFVNTIASNVLFNAQTEMVSKEGSPDVSVINTETNGIPPSTISSAIVNTTSVTRLQAIRDTEYSHPNNGEYVYHCGIDIFNNHMLRSNSFVHINKIGTFSEREEHKQVYNTISDFMRNGEGRPIKMNTNPDYKYTEKIPLHIYTMDNCVSFKNAYTNKIKEKDGWLGFYNPGNIDIPNSDNTDILINKMMANNKPCEFIDMYPGRSLYSFVPNYNKYRNRVERNWDYYITYPFSSDTAIINTIFGGENQCMKASTVESGYSQSSVGVVTCRTFLKHTFRPGDEIAIYYYADGAFNKYSKRVQIYSTGDETNSNKDRIFSIRMSDIQSIYNNLYVNGFYYKKIVRSQECEYYARLYKKIQRVNIDGERSGELRSDLNKASFAQNIYGDRTAQIVFTDDINTEGLTDNLGRKVSEVFFTTVKTNRGNTEWEAGDYSNSSVEFSHCFGNVMCGLYFGDDLIESLKHDRIDNNYNIRKINLANKNNSGIDLYEYFGDMVRYGSGMTCNVSDDVFYGDIVEFDKYNYTETELSPFLHRFNTVQREKRLVQGLTTNDVLGDIRWDNIKRDDYEPDDTGRIAGFATETIHYANKVSNGYIGHLSPEGYFYNPHTRIEIKEVSDRISAQAKIINFYSNLSSGEPTTTIFEGKTKVEIKYPTDYGFNVHDIIAVYDAGSDDQLPKTFFGEVTSLDKDSKKMVITFEGKPFGPLPKYIGRGSDNKKRYYMYYSKTSVPEYSIIIPSTNEFVWRDFVAPSEMSVNDPLFDTAFSNGRFYIEKNINLFVRRQDPFGDFGLLYAKDAQKKNSMEYFRLPGEQIDLSSVHYFYNNIINNTCY